MDGIFNLELLHIEHVTRQLSMITLNIGRLVC
jgi:hypothetical protein